MLPLRFQLYERDCAAKTISLRWFSIGNYLYLSSWAELPQEAEPKKNKKNAFLKLLLLLITIYIPLCVYLSIDMMRFIVAILIYFDKNIPGVKVRNSDLVSTIGRIVIEPPFLC